MDEQKMTGTCGGGACDNCASCKGGACSPLHWSCCVVPLLGILFWIGGIVSLVLAWVAGEMVAFGMGASFWYVNALALGVLAMGGRGKRVGSCRKGGTGCCSGGSCAGCKDGVCK